MRIKKIINITLLIAFAFLSSWIYSRWNIWFGPRIEDAYVVSNSPHHFQLTFSNAGSPHEHIVSWRTGVVDSTLFLSYFINGGADTFKVRPIYQLFKNDSTSAVYYKAVIPTPVAGVYTYSVGEKQYSFNVLSRSEFTTLCLGDIQNKDGGMQSLLDSIVSFVEPDFIIQVGDLVERPFMKYWDIYFDDFKNIAPRIPMLVALGNHDYHRYPRKYPDKRFHHVFPYFYADSIILEQWMPYELSYGDVTFYLFDTNRFLPELNEQGEYFEYKYKNKGQNEKVVAIMHHPPYSAKSLINNLDVKVGIVGALKSVGVDIVIAGHEHQTELRLPSEDDDIPFIQSISHISNKNYSSNEINSRSFSVLKYRDGELFYEIYNDKMKLINKIKCESH